MIRHGMRCQAARPPSRKVRKLDEPQDRLLCTNQKPSGGRFGVQQGEVWRNHQHEERKLESASEHGSLGGRGDAATLRIGDVMRYDRPGAVTPSRS